MKWHEAFEHARETGLSVQPVGDTRLEYYYSVVHARMQQRDASGNSEVAVITHFIMDAEWEVVGEWAERTQAGALAELMKDKPSRVETRIAPVGAWSRVHIDLVSNTPYDSIGGPVTVYPDRQWRVKR